MTCDASAADMKSASAASEVPPGLYAVNRTSSALKSVGFTITRAPFESFHSAAPMLVIGFDETILPAGGRGLDERCPTKRSRSMRDTVAFAARSNAARTPALRRTATPALIGDCAMMTRFSSVIQLLASVLTSASVIVGRSCCASLYSYSMPGIDSPWRKLPMYSSTSCSDCVLSRSAYERS